MQAFETACKLMDQHAAYILEHENHDLAITRSSSSLADPGLRVAFKCLNTPSKGSRHTDLSWTDRLYICHRQTNRFHICYQTEALTDTAFYSLGLIDDLELEINALYHRQTLTYLTTVSRYLGPCSEWSRGTLVLSHSTLKSWWAASKDCSV